MTEAITFDTHKFVKNLTEHGFSLEQAEALAAEQVNLLNSNLATKADLSNLATKADLSNMATKADLSNLATKTELSNLATKTELSNMATLTDLAEIKTDLSNMATLTDLAEIKTDLAELKADLLKWMIGALIAQGGVIVALISLLG